jgi:rubrerythrin
MADKPSYLKLLNGISCAETRASQVFSAWADVTTDPDVRAVLRTVAVREGEHGMAFAKRVNELGFELRPADDPTFAERMEMVRSDRSDLDKAESIGLLELATAPDVPDVFDSLFRDHTIDIQTGELLGRYVAEEFDTARLLRCCYDQLKARQGPTPAASATAGSAATGSAAESAAAGSAAVASSELAALNDKVDALCRAVEELRQIVCAQSMPTKAS